MSTTSPRLIATLRLRSPLLFWGGLILFIGAGLMVIPLMVDDRTVLGINTWIKPIKFFISTAIYIWTFSYLIHDIKRWPKLKSILKWTVFVIMFIEMVIIAVQGARAVRSHFNFDTDLDSLMFAVMGLLILINTVLIFILTSMYFYKHDHLHPTYLLGVRLGLLVFIVGNLIGGIMISNGQHAVGVTDGGAGLPFVNWSTTGGDIRVGHFLGLHAIQLIPLCAYWIKENMSTHTTQKILVATVAGLYALIIYLLTTQALAGTPLISS